jgi:hypothetical protein
MTREELVAILMQYNGKAVVKLKLNKINKDLEPKAILKPNGDKTIIFDADLCGTENSSDLGL